MPPQSLLSIGARAYASQGRCLGNQVTHSKSGMRPESLPVGEMLQRVAVWAGRHGGGLACKHLTGLFLSAVLAGSWIALYIIHAVHRSS